MNAMMDLYHQISELDQKLIGKWSKAVRSEIDRFGKNIQPVSPFIDRLTLKDDKRRGRFWIRVKRDNSIRLYGIAPNVGRVRGFNAPVNQWQDVATYRFQYAKKKPTFGRRRSNYGKGWVTYHRAQVTSATPGVETKQPYFGGLPVRPTSYFGIGNGKSVWGYGRVKEGAVPVYYRDSFADWLMQSHGDEIDHIVIETGQAILSDYISGGSK